MSKDVDLSLKVELESIIKTSGTPYKEALTDFVGRLWDTFYHGPVNPPEDDDFDTIEDYHHRLDTSEEKVQNLADEIVEALTEIATDKINSAQDRLDAVRLLMGRS